MQGLYDEIRKLTADGHTAEAVEMAESALANRPDATLHYLLGNALLRSGDRAKAMGEYLKAESLSPGGPASEALQMCRDIMDFYHKDLYNP